MPQNNRKGGKTKFSGNYCFYLHYLGIFINKKYPCGYKILDTFQDSRNIQQYLQVRRNGHTNSQKKSFALLSMNSDFLQRSKIKIKR